MPVIYKGHTMHFISEWRKKKQTANIGKHVTSLFYPLFRKISYIFYVVIVFSNQLFVFQLSYIFNKTPVMNANLLA